MTPDASADFGSANRPRFYGTDSVDGLEALAEVTVEEDGRYTLRCVILEKP